MAIGAPGAVASVEHGPYVPPIFHEGFSQDFGVDKSAMSNEKRTVRASDMATLAEVESRLSGEYDSGDGLKELAELALCGLVVGATAYLCVRGHDHGV